MHIFNTKYIFMYFRGQIGDHCQNARIIAQHVFWTPGVTRLSVPSPGTGNFQKVSDHITNKPLVLSSFSFFDKSKPSRFRYFLGIFITPGGLLKYEQMYIWCIIIHVGVI